MARARIEYQADMHDRHSAVVPVGRCTFGPVMELRRFGQPVTRFVAGKAQMNKIRAKSGKISISTKAVERAQICMGGRR